MQGAKDEGDEKQGEGTTKDSLGETVVPEVVPATVAGSSCEQFLQVGKYSRDNIGRKEAL